MYGILLKRYHFKILGERKIASAIRSFNTLADFMSYNVTNKINNENITNLITK